VKLEVEILHRKELMSMQYLIYLLVNIIAGMIVVLIERILRKA